MNFFFHIIIRITTKYFISINMKFKIFFIINKTFLNLMIIIIITRYWLVYLHWASFYSISKLDYKYYYKLSYKYYYELGYKYYYDLGYMYYYELGYIIISNLNTLFKINILKIK